jgi:hypothetical protein
MPCHEPLIGNPRHYVSFGRYTPSGHGSSVQILRIIKRLASVCRRLRSGKHDEAWGVALATKALAKCGGKLSRHQPATISFFLCGSCQTAHETLLLFTSHHLPSSLQTLFAIYDDGLIVGCRGRMKDREDHRPEMTGGALQRKCIHYEDV